MNAMKIFAKRQLIKSIVLFLTLGLVPALSVLAHGDGTSIEKVLNGYLVDIGYSPTELKTGEQARFDFLLHKASAVTNTAEDDTSRVPVDFSSVFVRLEKDNRLLFAGELNKPEFGKAGFSYVFPSSGDYSGYARYSHGDETLVEAEFEFSVAEGEGDSSTSFGSSVPALIVGLLAGVLLSTLWRGSRNPWPWRLTLQSFLNTSKASQPMQEPRAAGLSGAQKVVTSSLLIQLVIGIICAVGAYYATSWYLAGEIKWPDFNFPSLLSEESENKPAASTGIEKAEVVLTERGFQPSEITVKQGTEVTFSTNANRPFWPASNLHPSHEIYSAFDPKRPIAANETWSFVFDQVGDWNMHDHIRSYFTGTIHVVP